MQLEALNIGRLRVAAKGMDRVGEDDAPAAEALAGKPALVAVPEPEQWERGMYMIGQVAALRDSVTTLAELHREVSHGAVENVKGLRSGRTAVTAEPEPPAARRGRNRRDRLHPPRSPGRGELLGEHPREGRRDPRDPARALGLASDVRPRPRRPGQGLLPLGRVHRPGGASIRWPSGCRRSRCSRSSRSSCWRCCAPRQRSRTPDTGSDRSTANAPR